MCKGPADDDAKESNTLQREREISEHTLTKACPPSDYCVRHLTVESSMVCLTCHLFRVPNCVLGRSGL